MSTREILAFEKKISSTLIEPIDIAMANVSLGKEMEGKNLDPTVPAFIALHVFQAVSNASGIAQAAMIIANRLFNENKHDHALRYLLLAEQYFPDDDTTRMKAYVLNKIGLVRFHLKQYEKSLESFTTSVGLFESFGDLVEVSKIYCSLGLIYQDLKQPDRANEMFQKAASIARTSGNDADARRYESLIL